MGVTRGLHAHYLSSSSLEKLFLYKDVNIFHSFRWEKKNRWDWDRCPETGAFIWDAHMSKVFCKKLPTAMGKLERNNKG